MCLADPFYFEVYFKSIYCSEEYKEDENTVLECTECVLLISIETKILIYTGERVQILLQDGA